MIYVYSYNYDGSVRIAADGWREQDHPRDAGGRFTDGSGSVQNEVDSITREEYGRVMHELNTNLTKEQRKKKIIKKAIGNYIYTVKNYGFNEYKIVRKVRIDEFN